MVMRLTIDDRSMRRFIRQMPAAGKRSIARALNKAITQTNTRAARDISDKRNIKVGHAKGDMRVYKANTAKPEASIVAKGKPIRVVDVKTAKRQTKRGVTAKITARGKPHLFEGAFIAKLDSGHVGVFKRADKLKRKSSKDSKGTQRFNLPIMEMTLPSVSATMVQADIERMMRSYAAPVYQAEVERLLRMEMTKAGAK